MRIIQTQLQAESNEMRNTGCVYVQCCALQIHRHSQYTNNMLTMEFLEVEHTRLYVFSRAAILQ